MRDHKAKGELQVSMHRFAKMSAFCALLMINVPAMALTYTVKKISPSNGTYFNAAGLNNAGQVSGSVGDNAFVTGANGSNLTAIPLPPRFAADATVINNAGLVAGIYLPDVTSSQVQHAFVVGTYGEGFRDLGTFGGKVSYARGINDMGSVVGRAESADRIGHAFVYHAGSDAITALNLPADRPSIAVDINNAGSIVGWAGLADGKNHAYALDAAGALTFLDFSAWTTGASWAYGINDRGMVTGTFRDADNSLQGYYTGPDGLGISRLGTLGRISSSANAINASGVIVGQLFDDLYAAYDESHGFFTGADGQGMYDLNDFASLGAGRHFADILAVNDNGQMLAVDNFGESYLLTLDATSSVPEPSALALTLLGLMLIAIRPLKRRALTPN